MSRYFRRRFNPDLTLPVSQVQATSYAYQVAYLEWVITQLENEIEGLDVDSVIANPGETTDTLSSIGIRGVNYKVGEQESEDGSGTVVYTDPHDTTRTETVGTFNYSRNGTGMILHFNELSAPTISLTGVSVALPELSGKVRIPTTRGVWKTVDDEGIYVIGTTAGGDVYLTLTGSGSTTSVLTNLPKLSDYTIALIAFEKS